ncbi:hypothetical protein H257_07441 [Aphanomyces astaci]|uniref:Uncharacterized protein n=1 Tax=Aphanomyces astaci TaxID=112090 RepID=W4GK63_APHAT|nr:hypothetical protein H257_07441 [Aphanomyces astaci]ETV79429.1 hypothetical protein H257_07441 [Aphanomyces astaci]RQM19264.1 hypothetical protein B5M09_013953 [Aphanomyces astaci]|eukprot:XP_009831270.1 hypothetical protein H257_07441 [Aphanomyces astaci]
MSSNRGASTYEIADKIPPRRQYFREKQREYRRKMIADGATAKAQCVHLQSILVRLQTARLPSMAPREASDGPLSWHSIAKVFKSEAHRVLTDRQSLITQTQEFESLRQAMQHFVMMNIQPPMSRSNTWQNATLLADPSARILGKEWLTKQMYHNILEAFSLFPVVSYDDELVQFDLEEDDGVFTWKEQIQFTWPGTVQMFRRLVETNMLAVNFPHYVEATSPYQVVQEITANTRQFHTITPTGNFVNWLQGHFVEADRLIMVMRQVEHDELYICHPLRKQRHDMLWTEVRQVSPTHIVLRSVSRVSQLFRPATGFMSVDEFATLKGVDLTGIDDGLKGAYLRREMIRGGHEEFLPWRQHFMDVMHQSATQ